jgi:hypothetical protein
VRVDDELEDENIYIDLPPTETARHNKRPRLFEAPRR